MAKAMTGVVAMRSVREDPNSIWQVARTKTFLRMGVSAAIRALPYSNSWRRAITPTDAWISLDPPAPNGVVWAQ